MNKILILVLSLFSLPTHSQAILRWLVEHPDSLIQKYDTNYVKPQLKKLTLRYYINVKQNALNFNVLNDPINYQYQVKDELRYGVGFGYRWLILNGAYHFNPQNNLKKYDFQLNITGKKFLYDLRAQWYKGYQFNQGNFREDAQVTSLGGSLRYNFNNKKYSFKSSYDQTQWQIKSAGTPLIGINYNYTKITTDSLLKLGNRSNLTLLNHETFHLGFGGGYSHTFVHKKHWFLTFTLMVYLEGQFSGMGESSAPKNQLKIMPEPRMAAGYNSDKFYLGLTGTFHQYPGQLSDKVSYTYQYNSIKLIFAHRINFNPFKKK